MSKVQVFISKRPTLDEAQKIVGGLVQLVTIPDFEVELLPEAAKTHDWVKLHQFHNLSVQMLVNEEGLILSLPYNDEASDMVGYAILGPAIILIGKAMWD
tara:strand:+ start:85 stop:384 length:300 start_codon:yes stop_codon:yes gene_type:complete